MLITTLGAVGTISLITYSTLTKKNNIYLSYYKSFETQVKVEKEDLGKTLRGVLKYKKPVYFDTRNEFWIEQEEKNKTLDDIMDNKEALLKDYNLVEISREIFDRMDSFGKGNSGINYTIIPMMLHDTSFDNIPNSQIEELKKHYRVTIIRDNQDNNKSTEEIISVKNRETNKTIYYISKAEELRPLYSYNGKNNSIKDTPPQPEFILYSIGFKEDINIKKKKGENQIDYLIDIAEQVKEKGGFTVIGNPFTDTYNPWKWINQDVKEDLYKLIDRMKQKKLPVMLQVFDSNQLLWMKKSNIDSNELIKENPYIIPIAGSGAKRGSNTLYGGIIFDISDISTSNYTAFINNLKQKIESRNYSVIKQYITYSTWIQEDIFPIIKRGWKKADNIILDIIKNVRLW